MPSLNFRTILWTSKVPGIFGASSMSSGSSKTSHSGRYRDLIPLIVLSAYYQRVICVFCKRFCVSDLRLSGRLRKLCSLLSPRHCPSGLFHDDARYSTMSLRTSYQFGQSNQEHIENETGPRIHHSKREL